MFISDNSKSELLPIIILYACVQCVCERESMMVVIVKFTVTACADHNWQFLGEKDASFLCIAYLAKQTR